METWFRVAAVWLVRLASWLEIDGSSVLRRLTSPASSPLVSRAPSAWVAPPTAVTLIWPMAPEPS